ncbi:GPI anchored protein [Diaporthe helianthi]|uniref:GPI anchored protein n=1 Tax=Diaporthe helianthi TaxID=158607 RepID=A0A2P5HZI4_DIAHE|nr:GPI anchored protein [Diaporthe helianthi]
MRPLTIFAKLPTSLLLLVAARVGLSHGQADAQRLPIAIRKMSPDAGEKLLHEYYAFGPDEEVVAQVGSKAQPATFARAVLDVQEEELLAVNSSASISFRAPFAPHFGSHLTAREDESGLSGWHLFQRARDAVARLEKRQFACPTGTSDCSAIGFPNSCCQAGTECVQITDTGLGQGCPSDIGGGCCIEGFVCASVGCVQSVTVTETVVTRTSTLTSTANNGSPTTIIVTITATPSASTTTSTSTSISSTSSRESSTTATSTSTSSTETSAGPGAPVRPTSMSTLTTPPGYCPTGFYACSAVHGGGCCQTGRDCHVTSCPSTASTTIISGDRTIVVPVTAVPTTTSDATCAGGWSLCPASAGPTAGCCPSGYNCGTASCFLATGGATASLAKEFPANSGVGGLSDGMVRSLRMIPAALGFAFGLALF